MKSFAHLLLLAIALTGSLAHAAHDPALSGCWRSTNIVMQFRDGTRTQDQTGRCTLRYRDEEIESSCATPGGTATSTYRYAVVRPHFYTATMTGSSFRTGMLGSSREYEYRITGDRLVLVNTAQPTAGAASMAPVRVESESKKEPCP